MQVITLNGNPIFYDVKGSREPLIFLHRYFLDSRAYVKVTARLSSKIKYILLIFQCMADPRHPKMAYLSSRL